MREPKEEIKDRLDVAELVGGYITLKPSGSGSFKALCPFHSERSPSFHVSTEKQIWHCFGCSKGGDIFSFVMELEGLSFPEALRLLGSKAGVEIPEFNVSKTKTDQKNQLKDLHELSVKFYQTILWKHEQGELARTYLHSRGIDHKLAEKFKLGAAPESWDTLVKFLATKKQTEKRILDAGLAQKRKSGSGLIDRFRNRLMIPLNNAQGETVGFTARLLVPQSEKTGPKYLNSPETDIYHKSEILYGFDLAKKAIREKQQVIIVEGNLDVIASHKAGIEHVVASSGTALTEQQLKQMKRITNHVIFCFDDDSAGYDAAKRGIHLAQQMQFQISAITIPRELGKDPDDVVQKDAQAWRNITERPTHIMEYFFSKALNDYSISDVESKKQFTKFILEEIQRLPDVIEREHWLQKLADIIQIDLSILRSKINQPAAQPQTQPTPRPVAQKPKEKQTKHDAAVEYCICALLLNEEITKEYIEALEKRSLGEIWGEVYKKMQTIYTNQQTANSTQKSFFSEVRDSFEQDGKNDIVQCIDAAVLKQENFNDTLSRTHARTEFEQHLHLIQEASRTQKKQFLQSQIRLAEQAGDQAKLQELMQQFTKLL